jgi:hypothetical protein
MQKDPEVGGRQHPRITYAGGTATVRCSNSGSNILCTLIDLIASGCLVSMPEPSQVTPNQMIEVRLDLTHLSFRAMGFVRHMNRPDNAVGIEFHRLSKEDKSDLDEFIRFFAPL